METPVMKNSYLLLPLLLSFAAPEALASAKMESADTPGPAGPVVYSKEKREAFRVKALERCRRQHGAQAVSVEVDFSRSPPRSWCVKS
jgi:hypothetical protein